MAKEEKQVFRCNICGKRNAVERRGFGREISSCRRCRSTVRSRSIIHALSTELFGRCLRIRDFPRSRDLVGIGLSDNPEYAKRLPRRLDYTNTFFDREPRLDITAPDPAMFGTLDFLISSDVFEHVAPPASRAFESARRLLKPGGVLVLTVPFGPGKTQEHFPDLHDYRLETRGDRRVLVNRTVDGREQVFENLVFHGGTGATLEMRQFSRADVLRIFREHGFGEPRVHEEDHADCGMIWRGDPSVTVTARLPAA